MTDKYTADDVLSMLMSKGPHGPRILYEKDIAELMNKAYTEGVRNCAKEILNGDIEDIRIENYELKEHIGFLENQIRGLCSRDDAIRALLSTGKSFGICKDVLNRLSDSNPPEPQ